MSNIIKIRGTERDLNNLPMWAQDYVARLRSEVRDAENALRVATEGAPSGTRVLLDGGCMNTLHLPDHTRVTFLLGDDPAKQVEGMRRVPRGDYIEFTVHRSPLLGEHVVTARASHSLVVRPWVTNVVTLANE